MIKRLNSGVRTTVELGISVRSPLLTSPSIRAPNEGFIFVFDIHMDVFQIIAIIVVIILAVLLGWWLGRCSHKPVTEVAPAGLASTKDTQAARPEPQPYEGTDKQDVLHNRLAAAAAEMVLPLESYFSCGVELNLKTASLTKELLAKLPAREAAALVALQSGLDRKGLDQLSATSGFSLAELEGLRQKFAADTAAALLPKIKQGLSSDPDVKPAVDEIGPISTMTERLTLSTEPEEILELKRQVTEAKQELQRITTTHIPKSRLDSLQDEYSQLKKLQAEQVAALEEFKSTHIPKTEWDKLHAEFTGQETALLKWEEKLAQMQSALRTAEDKIAELTAQAESAQGLKTTLEEIRSSHLPKADWDKLHAEFTSQHTTLQSENATLRESLEDLQQTLDAAQTADATSRKLAQDLEQAEMALREAQESGAELEQELAGTQARLKNLEEARNTAEETLDQLQEKAAQATARASELESELAEAQSQARDHAAQLEILLPRLDSAEAALKSAHEELAEASVPRPSDSPIALTELQQEFKIVGAAHARTLDELEKLRQAYAAIPSSQHELAEKLSEVERSKAELETQCTALRTAVEAGNKAIDKLKSDIESQLQGTIPRSDYDALRTEADKARHDLSNALAQYTAMKQRLDSIGNASSIEKLKAALAQEEKAHGSLRIQYRNLESRLYEAVGGRKRVEAELKSLSKEREKLLAKIQSFIKPKAERSKLPTSTEEETPAEGTPTEIGAPKQRSRKKKSDHEEVTSSPTDAQEPEVS